MHLQLEETMILRMVLSMVQGTWEPIVMLEYLKLSRPCPQIQQHNKKCLVHLSPLVNHFHLLPLPIVIASAINNVTIILLSCAS
jgi:hypothetical protein